MICDSEKWKKRGQVSRFKIKVAYGLLNTKTLNLET